MPSAPVLEASDLRKTYAGKIHVLNGIDLQIDAGELLAIVGPSGSGKSTLLHIMGTLDRPTSGTIAIAGHDTDALSDRELASLRARAIGFVFQQFFLIDGMTATENVAQGLLYSGVPAAERRARATQTLDQVGLAHRLDHHPNQLSGGERQRVAIARALTAKPQIVFADEPTGNLDSRSGAQIVGLLNELNDAGTTIAVITHDRELATRFPRQIHLRDGVIECET